ncbi:hypothetical protein BKH42_06510 [Helicobacter sp. 13S00482-2]|nr:hypothetical protein BKH42_06510 [Helicobacter sp. 13S00482-2]
MHIHSKDLNNVRIFLPFLPEQKTIASVLTCFRLSNTSITKNHFSVKSCRKSPDPKFVFMVFMRFARN